MKKLLLLLLFIPLAGFGQYDSNKLKPTSVKNFNTFLNYAKKNNKLVIISFSADKNTNAPNRIPESGMMTVNTGALTTGLCEKCDIMNKELWNSEEFKRLENYILIEINRNYPLTERLFTKYRIGTQGSFPKVIIEVANNEDDIINEGLDTRSVIISLNELEYLNKLDFTQVYAAGTDNRKIGEAYRNLHKKNKKKLYKRILELSSKHFRRALKKEKNTINQLNLLYNLKLKGSYKKANKKLEKLKLVKANLSDIETEIIQNIIDNSN